MKSRTLTNVGLGAASVATALTPMALPVTAAVAKAKPKPKPKTRTKTFKGPVERTIFSNVQVSISVAGRKIEALSVSANPQDQQSYAREAYALPLLRKEALRSQSYRIHTISGVTTTSQAFIVSLYSAMRHAHLG